MAAYDENPTRETVLTRTRGRISTVRSALEALATSGRKRNENERAHYACRGQINFDCPVVDDRRYCRRRR